MQTKFLKHAARVPAGQRFEYGDKVFIDRHSVGFYLHQGQDATCVDWDFKDEVAIELKSGDILRGSSKGLIITGLRGGTAPAGAVIAEFDPPE